MFALCSGDGFDDEHDGLEHADVDAGAHEFRNDVNVGWSFRDHTNVAGRLWHKLASGIKPHICSNVSL